MIYHGIKEGGLKALIFGAIGSLSLFKFQIEI